MAELMFFLTLALPFAIMLWLVRARRKAVAKVAPIVLPDVPLARFATEETTSDHEGHQAGTKALADHEILAPDHSGGEIGAVRAMQGRP